VIVGSALVERIEQLGPAPVDKLALTVEEFLSPLRAAVTGT